MNRLANKDRIINLGQINMHQHRNDQARACFSTSSHFNHIYNTSEKTSVATTS